MLTEGVYCSPPSDMMRPRPLTEPRFPHSRSIGRVRFSRLGCPMSSNGWSNGLGCISNFWWCFAYLSNATSRTCGIFKSSCSVRLDTNQGALVIMRRIFYCAFCSIVWLVLLAQPQTSMPYVQIGFIIVLYIKSLFAIDSCDCLPSSQDNVFTFSSICFLFVTMWSLQFSLWSRCIPRYFVTAECRNVSEKRDGRGSADSR